jgi:CheY-like chemotaxis protein
MNANKWLQYAAAGFLLVIALLRAMYPQLVTSMDSVFLGLVAAALILILIPLKNLRSLKAAGIEVTIESPQVKGAVGSLKLDRLENQKLRSKLEALAPVLGVVNGARVLWIDDRPEKVTGERRLLRALGVVVANAISSDSALEILKTDNDFDLIVTDIQREGDYYKITDGVKIHDGVNFITWLRTECKDPIAKEIPVIFYAAYDWQRLVDFTRPARELTPEASISNSVLDFVPKVVHQIIVARSTPIQSPESKIPTGLREEPNKADSADGGSHVAD